MRNFAPKMHTYLLASTVLDTTVGPLIVYKKSEGQIMKCYEMSIDV